jgi:chemotaxis protein CheZ
MTEEQASSSEILDHARELVRRLESGEADGVNDLLEEMTRIRESTLFQEIGKLTRNLHEALKTPAVDDRIAALAEEEMPDARKRLQHVVKMTDDAAHRTLNAVEESLPLTEGLRDRAGELGASWNRFLQRDMPVEEFRGLSREIGEFLGQVSDDSVVINKNLSDVLMAQDFQDLTGQVIDRVLNLVQEVEDKLVELIRVSGKALGHAEEVEQFEQQERDKLAGPAVPGMEAGDTLTDQDDVDDLLSSLGF